MAFNNNKGEFQFPYDIVDVDPEVNSELLRDFTGVFRCNICVHSALECNEN